MTTARDTLGAILIGFALVVASLALALFSEGIWSRAAVLRLVPSIPFGVWWFSFGVGIFAGAVIRSIGR